MSQEPIKKYLIDGDENLFSNSNIKYSIPLYQRDFSWSENEINQLIEDINDFSGTKYYLGSLIVDKKEENENTIYQVIDGQQRLTALFLLFNYLQIDNIRNVLTFRCRQKSTDTLAKIYENASYEDFAKQDLSNLDKNLIKGYDIIKSRFDQKEYDRKINIEHFKENLRKVILFIVELPENTDLIKYFEVMNTRGKQLEEQDILKAKLLGKLETKEEREKYSKIWDACSDMSGYVQMHFEPKTRYELFGEDWNNLPNINNLQDLPNLSNKFDKDEKENNDKYKSIITFPYFLLHSLKVFVNNENITVQMKDLLEDQKLVDTFDNVMKNGYIYENKIDGYEFSKKFIENLLTYRFLFDKYILKRNYEKADSSNDIGTIIDDDGEWSLHELKASNDSNKKPQYSNTNINNGENVLMLEAAMRVSITSSKVMHWITKTLIELTNSSYDLETFLEKLIKQNIKKSYFLPYENGNIDGKNIDTLGVETPHMVFNYIDYLLWKEEPTRYKDFKFTFRNSVEHWYPRNPSSDTVREPMTDEEGLNCLGNLCLLQRNINSKLSNDAPSGKIANNKEKIDNGSIKLRIMAQKIIDAGGISVGDRAWRTLENGTNQCRMHCQEMMKLIECCKEVEDD